MNVKNFALPESFSLSSGSFSDNLFADSVHQFSQMVEQIPELEGACYPDSIFEQEILPGVRVMDLYSKNEDDPLYSEKELLMRTIGTMRQDSGTAADSTLYLLFYAIPVRPRDYALTAKEYLALRRHLLCEIQNPVNFSAFMPTCFPDIVFSVDIETGLRGIKRFQQKEIRTAIVHDLSVLNDTALDIYRRCHPNIELAYQALRGQLLDCSPDKASHNKDLTFFFPHSDGRGVRPALCSPHTKLLRRDSDLRIYFSWENSAIGDDSKILVGHIGKHPYN